MAVLTCSQHDFPAGLLETLSQQFQTKYLLAIMNSSFARDWVAIRRRGKLDIYPDDWKHLPIVNASDEEQSALVARVDEILLLYSTHGYPLPASAASHLAELEIEIEAMVTALYELQGEASTTHLESAPA